MNRIHVTHRARSDIREIWNYIAADNRGAADALLKAFYEKFELLQATPEVGCERKDLEGGLRSFPVGRYIIFYLLPEETIKIVRVLHGARDIDTLL